MTSRHILLSVKHTGRAHILPPHTRPPCPPHFHTGSPIPSGAHIRSQHTRPPQLADPLFQGQAGLTYDRNIHDRPSLLTPSSFRPLISSGVSCDRSHIRSPLLAGPWVFPAERGLPTTAVLHGRPCLLTRLFLPATPTKWGFPTTAVLCDRPYLLAHLPAEGVPPIAIRSHPPPLLDSPLSLSRNLLTLLCIAVRTILEFIQERG